MKIHRVFTAAAVAAFLLCAGLCSRSAALAEDDAAALLAKHQKYAGWHIGDGVIKTLRAEGAVTRDGKTIDTLTLLRYGVAHSSLAVNDRGFRSASGFTGNVYWTSNTNGFTVRPVGEIGHYLYDLDAVFGELTGTLQPQTLRHESVDGTDTVVLHLISQVGFPMNVYVDPSTGAYKRIVIDPDGKYEDTINGIAYTEIDGKRFISTWHYGTSKYVLSYTKIEPNAKVEPDELRPPKQTATWTFGEGPSKVELTKGTFPRILVDVIVNGVKGRFILDTGAGGTAVIDSFARAAGAKRVGETTISGIGPNTPKANMYRFDTMTIGGSTLHNVIAESGLAEEWKEREGIVGLIGFDLLAGAIVDMNLDSSTLAILDPAKVEPNTSQGFTVRMDLSNHHIRVPMKLNDKYDVIATLDSGNPINVLFSRDLINREHLSFLVDPYQLGSTRYGGGVGGYEIEHCGKLQSLSLGPISYRPVPACDSSSRYRNEVLVGLDFMKAFNFVFDYPDGMMVMIPRKNP